MAVGVLALQGGFAAHLRALEDIDVRGVPVRSARELETLSGLILPGGESTTQLDLLGRLDMFEALASLWQREVPILATCAGIILAAARVTPDQRCLGWLDIAVDRNAYGRQADSFANDDDSGELPLVFIRAPRITHVGNDVDVLACHNSEPVLVRQGNVVGATFHPELTESRQIHRACFQRGAFLSDKRFESCCSTGHAATSLGPLGHEGRILHDVE